MKPLNNKCPQCGNEIKKFDENENFICPHCNYKANINQTIDNFYDNQTSKIELIDLFKSLGIFFIGFFGLSIISLLVQATGLIQLIAGSDASLPKLNALINFFAYAIGLAIILPIIGKTCLSKLIQEYKVPKDIRDGVAFGIIILCVTVLYNLIITQFVDISSNENEGNVESIITVSPILSTITVAFLGPIVEEFTYRYGLFRLLHKGHKILAYLGTILIFAFIHFDFTAKGDAMINELLNIPSYLIAAGLLCYAYDRKKSLACSTIAHVTNNLVSVISTLIAAAMV